MRNFVFTALLIIGCIVAGLALIALSAWLPFYFDWEPEFGYDQLGPLGDFLSGALGTLFSFASFAILIWALVLQRRELTLSTKALQQSAEELRSSAKIAEKQSTLLEQQREDGRFFELLRFHVTLRSSIRIPGYSDQGLGALKQANEHLESYDADLIGPQTYERTSAWLAQHGSPPPSDGRRAVLSAQEQKHVNLKGRAEAFVRQYDFIVSSARHYFRHLDVLLEYASSVHESRRDFFQRAIMAQLAEDELRFIGNFGLLGGPCEMTIWRTPQNDELWRKSIGAPAHGAGEKHRSIAVLRRCLIEDR
ncbi:MAG: hypothetical protein H7A21_06645 [Spirochaetales bacterium]|nr:hypothetical protein [Leptospiraceae bacterium]MCP5481091.1 hypothetical protein [Spirochaetales bacterium]